MYKIAYHQTKHPAYGNERTLRETFVFFFLFFFITFLSTKSVKSFNSPLKKKNNLTKNVYFFYFDNYQNVNMHVKQPIWRNETKSLETCLLLFFERGRHQISKKQRNHPIGEYKTTLLKRVFRVFFLGSYELKWQNTCKHPVRYQSTKKTLYEEMKGHKKKRVLWVFSFSLAS